MTKLEQLIEELCPNGVKFYELGNVAHYAKERIAASDIDENTYVGVENLLQNKMGKTTASSVPDSGVVIAFHPGNILIGNIRPYLRKIWLADCDGGTNGDVLTIQIDDELIVAPKYLYYVLSSEQFFLYDIQNCKESDIFESRNIYAYSLSEASPTLVSVKGLCYADFNGISLGSTAAEVMAIDPAVYIDDRPSMSEDYKNLSWMSLHLLDEGILYICYSRESEDQPYRVSGLRLYRDCALQELYSACSIRALDNFYVSPEDRPPRRDPVPAEPANKPDVLGDVPERENAIIVSNAYIHFLVERMENPELQPDIVWDWVQENPRYAPELPLFEWESWGSGVFSDSYNHQYDFRPVENDASRSLYYQMDSLHFLFPLVKAKAYRFIVLEGDEMHEVGPRIYASKIWRREDFKDIGRGDTLAALAKIDWTAEAYLDRKARPLTLRTFHLCEDGILAFDLARDDPDDQFRITKKTFCPGGDLSVLGIQLPAKAVIQEPDLPKEDAK